VAEILFEKNDVEEKFSQLKNGANEFPADLELPSISTSELRTVEQFKEVEEMYHELIISYIAALGKGAETAWNNIQTLGEADEALSQSMGS
jgi:hypothetical protein